MNMSEKPLSNSTSQLIQLTRSASDVAPITEEPAFEPKGKLRLLLIDNLDMPIESAYRFPQAGVPLGILSLSAFLKRELKDKAEFIHNVSFPLLVNKKMDCIRHVLDMMEHNDYNLIGIRTLTAGSEYLEMTTSTMKARFPDVPIICGGPYASDSPQDLLNSHSHVDFTCSNEGELAFLQFVQSLILMQDDGYRKVPGIGYRFGDRLVINPPMPFVAEVDELPIPDYGEVDLREYTYVENPMRIPNGKVWVPIMTQRGCPYRCNYCHEVFGKKSRELGVKRTIDEIKYLHYEKGVEHFAVLDDIFNVKRDRAKEIMREVIRSGMKIEFSFPNGVRGDIMDEELVDLMIEAGTVCIHYAVETASPRLQKWIQKNLRMNELNRIIDYTSKFDIIFRGFYMVGFPDETEDELKMTVDHAINSGFTETYLSILSMWPGTKIFEKAVLEGHVAENQFTKMTAHDYKHNGFKYDIDVLVRERTRGYAVTHFSRNRIEKNIRVYRKLGIDISRILNKEADYALLVHDDSAKIGFEPPVPDRFLYETLLSLKQSKISMDETISSIGRHLGHEAMAA
jgi:anaerobic magnesium-protoporphyrin IX monomethyl ester cyclase